MKEFVLALRADAVLMVRRFITDQPANFVERAIFDAIREIGERVGDWLAAMLDNFRGTTMKRSVA